MGKTYKVTGQNEYLIEVNGPEITVNGKKWYGEIIPESDGQYTIRTENKIYRGELLKTEDNHYEVKTSHSIHELKIEDELELLIKSMGLEKSELQKVDAVKAPMPGLIKEVLVKIGDKVQKGDTLLILEAMKMENSIKAAHDGEITDIYVGKGENVEKNQILIKY